MNDTQTACSSYKTRSARPALRRENRQSLLEQLSSVWAFVALLLVALQSVAGVRLAYAESNADSPGSGTLILHHPDGPREAIQLDANIELNVQGMLADMTLIQQFRNTSSQWLEGRYLFPLPENSAIRGFSVTIGERVILGQVQSRENARTTYQDARNSGKIAGLIEQQRPNLFTVKLASIGPGELIRIKLDVMLPVKLSNGTLSLQIPTTLTPRYSNEKTKDPASLITAMAPQSVIRGPRLTLQASVSPLDDISLVSNKTHTFTSEGKQLLLQDVPMDRDVAFSWPATFGEATRSHAYVSTHNGQRYVQLLINPPARPVAEDIIARELIMIVDKSGSMAGVSIDAAREALNFALDGLNENDYFNIVAFDDKTYPLFNKSVPATEFYKDKARNYANRLRADGGTEMESALLFALGNQGNERLRQIIFLTDGSVGSEDSLLMTIKHRLGENRLFTVGIGPAPNRWFLQKAAEAGRGISLDIQDSHDVAQSINALLTNLENPVITNLAVQYPEGNGEIYPNPIPDIYANRPGMLVARISQEVSEVIITGQQGERRWRNVLAIANTDSKPALKASPSSIAMHWARRKVESLMDEQRYAVDRDLHRNTITNLALDIGLVTRYTSFVAVDSEPMKPTTDPMLRTQVANLLPAGNEMMNISMPGTAAGADSLTLLSLVLGLTGVGLCFVAGIRPLTITSSNQSTSMTS